MKFQRKKLATLIAYTIGTGGAALGTVAYAQQATDSTAPADIKVNVTGSNIKRVEGESALPVTILTRQDIDRTGATSAIELMQFISANNSFGQINISNSVGATTFSQTGASLRGLGPAFTLVLIDGHRLENVSGAIAGFEGGVNLQTIPFEAIERVEILKDGASAIYGSDAVAGVINFIMRQDFQGVTATAQYAAPSSSGGGNAWFVNSTVGFGDLSKDRYNVLITGQYQYQERLDQNQRSYSNTNYNPAIGLNTTSGNTFPGYITTGGIGSLNFPDCNNPPGLGNQVFGSRCRANLAQEDGVNMVPREETYNVFASGRFQINSDWQAYAQAYYADDKVNLVIQGTPISAQFNWGPGNANLATVTLPPTSPYYPHEQAAAAGVDGQPLNVQWRSTPIGLRNTTDENSGGQVIGGLKGTWKDWDFDGSLYYSEGKTTETLNSGFADYTKLLPLLDSGTVNLFGDSTPEAQAALQATTINGQVSSATSKTYGVGAKASGDIWKLPAGDMALAVGFDYRKEQLDQSYVAALQAGDITGYGGNLVGFDASRNVFGLYGELNIPIVKTLEGDVAVRYDHYSDFGSTTNPKVSLRWQPAQQVLFRGSYNTGFAAPTLYELNAPGTFGVTAVTSDPVRCPQTGLDEDCNHQFGITFGGSQELQPQTSKQWGFGMVLEPLPGFSASFDYFQIHLKNQIEQGLAPYQTILTNQVLYNSQITRGPQTPGFPDLPGPILEMPQNYVNIGATTIIGYDIDLRYRTPVSSIGRFTFGLQGTYYTNYKFQNPDGSWSDDVANMYAATVTGVIPRYKQYATVTWDYGPWSATLGNTYQTSYTDTFPYVNADGMYALRRVGVLSIWDLQASYSGFKNMTLTAGVKNLLNTNPPQSNNPGTFISGFDSSYYNPLGQIFYGSIKYSFK
jgi:iron complex outermembrane receptor protein